ncbi:MAG: hypothetical protein L3J84_02045 [Gammaproteobacteria bacterium]|nr:hypothetical protein [Gammaproteobacteria bacterium]
MSAAFSVAPFCVERVVTFFFTAFLTAIEVLLDPAFLLFAASSDNPVDRMYYKSGREYKNKGAFYSKEGVVAQIYCFTWMFYNQSSVRKRVLKMKLRRIVPPGNLG